MDTCRVQHAFVTVQESHRHGRFPPEFPSCEKAMDCFCFRLCLCFLWLGSVISEQTVGDFTGIAPSPPGILPTEEAGHSLVNSFYKLINSAEDSRNLSSFSDELASAVLTALHNLSSSFVRQKVAAEVDAASRNEMLSNPDSDSCSSRNYTRLCPVGWYELGDGKTCKASSEYRGDCESTADFSSSTPLSKQDFSRRCNVSWPCNSKCKEDFSVPCPEGWSDEGTLCKAPPDYRGNCVLQKQFAEFDEPSKARWAQACGVSWPCKEYDADFTTSACPVMWTLSVDGKACEAPPSYVGPCASVQDFSGASGAEKARIAAKCQLEWPPNFLAQYDFSEPCPLGWNVSELPEALPECVPSEEYRGRCVKVQRLAGITDAEKNDFMMKCSATWPIKDAAERNYEAPCPSLWRLHSKESGICVAPPTYHGPCQLRLSFLNYDAEVKKAFEGRCRAHFPASIFSVLPKLQPMVSAPLRNKATGPIGSPPTKFHGVVVPPNGTIYLPSSNRSYPTTPLAPPKAPDSRASRTAATLAHIKKLQQIRPSATDVRLNSMITDFVQELLNQGGTMGP